MQAGTECYGLKQMERLTDFERGHVIDKGAGAVVEYEKLDGRPRRRPPRPRSPPTTRTTCGRPWRCATGSSTSGPHDLPWRPAVLEASTSPTSTLDARIEALHAFGPGTDEHLMGDLLGYWRRERSATSRRTARCRQDRRRQIDDRRRSPAEVPSDCRHRTGKQGKELKWPGVRFTFPPQPIDADIKPGDEEVMFPLTDGSGRSSSWRRSIATRASCGLLWNARAAGVG